MTNDGDEELFEDFDELEDDGQEYVAVVIFRQPGYSDVEDMTPEPPRLNSLDRCDRCGVQAWVEVTFSNSTTLLFCSHHYNQHDLALGVNPDVVNVLDERDRLEVNRMSEVK